MASYILANAILQSVLIRIVMVYFNFISTICPGRLIYGWIWELAVQKSFQLVFSREQEPLEAVALESLLVAVSIIVFALAAHLYVRQWAQMAGGEAEVEGGGTETGEGAEGGVTEAQEGGGIE